MGATGGPVLGALFGDLGSVWLSKRDPLVAWLVTLAGAALLAGAFLDVGPWACLVSAFDPVPDHLSSSGVPDHGGRPRRGDP
jgi:hypothetical protein